MTLPVETRTAPAAEYIGVATGGCAALMVLSGVARTGRSAFGSEPAWHVLYSGPTAVQAIGAMVAVVVGLWSSGARTRLVIAAVGLVLAAGLSIGFDSLASGYAASVTAGVVLGCLAAHAMDVADHRVSLALIVGSIAGITGYRQLVFPFDDGDRFSTFHLVLIAVAVVAAVALGSSVPARTSRPPGDPSPMASSPMTGRRRAAIVGIALAVVAVVTDWAFTVDVIRSESGRLEVWWWGWVPVAAIVLGALLIRGVDGALLVIAGAWAVSLVGELTWVIEHSVWLLLVAVLVVAAALAGMRVRRPMLGVVVLGLCAATYLIVGSPLRDVYSMTTVFVAPAATAFAAAAVIARTAPSPPMMATALSGPAIWVIAPQLVYVTFAASGGDMRTVNSSFGPQSLTAAAERAIPMVIAIIACGIALALIVRRQRSEENAVQ